MGTLARRKKDRTHQERDPDIGDPIGIDGEFSGEHNGACDHAERKWNVSARPARRKNQRADGDRKKHRGRRKQIRRVVDEFQSERAEYGRVGGPAQRARELGQKGGSDGGERRAESPHAIRSSH